MDANLNAFIKSVSFPLFFLLFHGNDENPTGLEVIRDPDEDAAQVRELCPLNLLHLLLTTTYT